MPKKAAAGGVFALEKRIRETAKALDRLKTGALAASFGGGFVLGIFGGELWWIPAAMSGSLLVYRGVQFIIERQDNAHRKRLEEWDEVFWRVKELAASNLPPAEKHVLGAVLRPELPAPPNTKLLPPPDSDTPDI